VEPSWDPPNLDPPPSPPNQKKSKLSIHSKAYKPQPLGRKSFVEKSVTESLQVERAQKD